MPRLPRILTVLLALAGATLAAVAVQLGHFWVMADGAVSIGPTYSISCFNGRDCQRGTLAWVGPSDLWLRAGFATYAAGLIAAFAMVTLAGTVAAGRRARWPARFTLMACLTMGIAATVFVATLPPLSGAELGRGVVFVATAILLGLATAIFTLRQRRS